MIKRLKLEAEKKEHYYDMTLKQVDSEKETLKSLHSFVDIAEKINSPYYRSRPIRKLNLNNNLKQTGSSHPYMLPSLKSS